MPTIFPNFEFGNAYGTKALSLGLSASNLRILYAAMAELADALASGASGLTVMGVQVPLAARHRDGLNKGLLRCRTHPLKVVL